MLVAAYLLIGGALIEWANDLMRYMGYVFMLGAPAPVVLYLLLRGNDLVWYSYAAYVIGLVVAMLSGLLGSVEFFSVYEVFAVVMGGSVVSLALPLGILILMIPFERGKS